LTNTKQITKNFAYYTTSKSNQELTHTIQFTTLQLNMKFIITKKRNTNSQLKTPYSHIIAPINKYQHAKI